MFWGHGLVAFGPEWQNRKRPDEIQPPPEFFHIHRRNGIFSGNVSVFNGIFRKITGIKKKQMNSRTRNRWMIMVIIIVLGLVYFTQNENLAEFVRSDLQ